LRSQRPRARLLAQPQAQLQILPGTIRRVELPPANQGHARGMTDLLMVAREA
jgi:hypothetical protein